MTNRLVAATVAACALVLHAGCGNFPRVRAPRLSLPPLKPTPAPIRTAIDLYYEGLDHELNEQMAEAEEKYRASLAASPRPLVHYRLGRVLQKTGRLDEAEAEFNAALALAANYADAQEGLRQVQAAKGLQAISGAAPSVDAGFSPLPNRQLAGSPISQAVPEAVSAIEVIDVPPSGAPGEEPPAEAAPSPDSEAPPVRVAAPALEVADATLAEVAELLRQRRLDQAQQAVDRLLIAAGNDARVHYAAGNVAMARQELTSAQAAYERAIEIYPQFAKALNNLGVVHEALGRHKLAIEAYEKAIEAEELPEAIYNLAVLREKRGEIEQALALFRRYVEVDPGSTWTENAKLHIDRLQREM